MLMVVVGYIVGFLIIGGCVALVVVNVIGMIKDLKNRKNRNNKNDTETKSDETTNTH